MSFRYRHGDRPLEGYTVLRGVGRGGFGEVYYARSDGGREVALKAILQNEEIELRGVRHCINLKSPHLVSVFDVRKDPEGVAYVIMEHVTGPSLREILREHPCGLGLREAAFLARELARGLTVLHEHGIVHRDLKPENIFFEGGYVKIGDYGLAKLINASRQSGHTISVGTVHYMAPEIGSGNYSRSVDIYAFGVILYELVTGHVPFDGGSFGEVLMKHLTAPPDLAGIPEPFRAVIDGALRKNPAQRFQSVEEMVRGIVDDPALAGSFASFDVSTLTHSAAARADSPTVAVDGSPAAAAPAAAEGPPDVPPAVAAAAGADGTRDAADSIDQLRRSAERQAAAAAHHLREASWQVANHAGRVSRRLAVSLRRATRRFGGGPPASVSAPAAGRAAPAAPRASAAWSGRPGPPGQAAHVFWVLVGSACFAGAASAILSIAVMHYRPGEFMAAVAAGIGLCGFGMFSFYRGLWAHRAGPWRRTIRPFLLTCCANTAAISFVVLLNGTTLWPRGLREEWFVTLAVFVGAVFLYVFILISSRLVHRWRRIAASVPAGTPRALRPVPTIVRVVDLILGCAALGSAIATLSGALFFGAAFPWDRFAFLCFGVILVSLGVFFLRQANRGVRGGLWDGTLRPFLTTATIAALIVSMLPVVLGLPLREEEAMVFIVVGCSAIAIGLGLIVLRRGHRVAHGRR